VGAIEVLSGSKKRDWIKPLERWTIASEGFLGNTFWTPGLRHPGVNDGAIGSEFGGETGLWPEL
jgi:hypothetical protein